MERVTRIELAFSAWEADVLPLNYTRGSGELTRRHVPVPEPGRDTTPGEPGAVSHEAQYVDL